MRKRARTAARNHLAPSLKVAAVATLVVIVVYAGAVAALDVFVAHRLVAQVDRQLSNRLAGKIAAPSPGDKRARLARRRGPLRHRDLRRADLCLGSPPRKPCRATEHRLTATARLDLARAGHRVDHYEPRGDPVPTAVDPLPRRPLSRRGEPHRALPCRERPHHLRAPRRSGTPRRDVPRGLAHRSPVG